jgi:hypothetical protein
MAVKATTLTRTAKKERCFVMSVKAVEKHTMMGSVGGALVKAA